MNPLQLVDKWGWCPFCLATRSATSQITVQHRVPSEEEGMQSIKVTYLPVEISPANPIKVSEWLNHQIVFAGEMEFEKFTLDSLDYAFVPVAIIQNTPLCTYHLWMQTDPRSQRRLV